MLWLKERNLSILFHCYISCDLINVHNFVIILYSSTGWTPLLYLFLGGLWKYNLEKRVSNCINRDSWGNLFHETYMFEDFKINTLPTIYFAFIHKKKCRCRRCLNKDCSCLWEHNLNVLTNRNARYRTELIYLVIYTTHSIETCIIIYWILYVNFMNSVKQISPSFPWKIIIIVNIITHDVKHVFTDDAILDCLSVSVSVNIIRSYQHASLSYSYKTLPSLRAHKNSDLQHPDQQP